MILRRNLALPGTRCGLGKVPVWVARPGESVCVNLSGERVYG